MIKIVHAADLHLDSAFAALSAEQAAQLRREQRRLLEDIAAETERRAAQLLLLSGDLFDSERCFSDTEEALCRALSQTRAQVFIAPGNHDWYGPRSPWERMKLPENVHVFRSPTIERVDLYLIKDFHLWRIADALAQCIEFLTGNLSWVLWDVRYLSSVLT